MRKVLKSLPSVRYTIVVVMICLAIGVLLAGGFHLKALLGLVFAAVIVAMATMRNHDPIAWEAFNDPHAHSMRLQRDAVVKQLRAVVNAYDSNHIEAVIKEVDEARELLADMQLSGK